MIAQPPSMGELEEVVMNVLWSTSPLAARDVLKKMKRRPVLAYTTVKTVLDRLHAKGLVEKITDGKAFLYKAHTPKDVWLAQRALHALGHAPSNGVLLAFLDSAERADPELMDRLSKLIEARKERGG